MRVSVCIPEGLYRASATLARRLGISRGALYGQAIAEYLEHHDGEHYVNPLIKQHVEPVLLEEMSRSLQKYATVADALVGPPRPRPTDAPASPTARR